MTDHLEPFRRMVRSIRFVPPTRRTQPSQHIEAPQTTSLPLGGWTQASKTTAEVMPAAGPAPDPSEHVAALVRDAVSKRTALPVTYTIAENIGDRISRLAIPKPVIPEYIPAEAPADFGTHHIPVVESPQHTGSEAQTPAQTSPTEESVKDDAVVPELLKIEEAISKLSGANNVDTQASEPEETQLQVTDNTEATLAKESIVSEEVQADTPASTAEETKPSNLLEEVVAAIKPVVEGVVAAVEPVVDAVLAPLQPSEEPQVQPSESPEVSCPKCQSTQIRKKGHYKDKQRYVCKDCGKQFMLPESSVSQDKQITEASSAASSNSAKTAKVEESSTQKQASNNTTQSSSRQSKTKKKAKGFGSGQGK